MKNHNQTLEIEKLIEKQLDWLQEEIDNTNYKSTKYINDIDKLVELRNYIENLHKEKHLLEQLQNLYESIYINISNK
ncbi:hypothetical protein TRIP_D300120 [uncultured Paludibacter sp.]|uniref:Uncharacterized protein n=1 Tax=uncultured Paludibacter sp. TaxID=497635 RepID=A0A653AAW1_9BACT|nr:hypothetical protein TRIP_D300120 [uncultured Paludibacter sp.]